jgi:hypothetical protein
MANTQTASSIADFQLPIADLCRPYFIVSLACVLPLPALPEKEPCVGSLILTAALAR